MRSFWGIIIISVSVGLYNCNSSSSQDKNAEENKLILPDSSAAITADINDVNDPIRSIGIDLFVGKEEKSGELTVNVESNNQDVVPNSNLLLSGTGSVRNLKITAISPGYATITVKVSNGSQQRSFTLSYAASLTNRLKAKRWHAGIADASAALAIDDNHMIVANDETNYFYLFNRQHSGPPLKTFDFNPNNALQLKDSSAGIWKEVDVEAAVTSTEDPSTSYWIGSMSNNSSFLYKPNRNNIFSVTVTGKGTSAELFNNGSYSNLREKLIAWGDKYGYDFSSSAASGKDSKTIDGFNIEGMVFGPDNKTLFIGFRAPLVPKGNRKKAVIAPVIGFEKWFNRGNPNADPLIGAPIELDLGGRGVRDIIRLSAGDYIIIAGSCGWELTPAAFTWTGNPKDAPVLIPSAEYAGLNMEGVVPVVENGRIGNKLQVLTDNGKDIFYCDTLYAKDLPEERFKKFSSVILPLSKH